MKRRLIGCAAALLLFASCDKFKNLGQFTIPVSYSTEVDMPMITPDSTTTINHDTTVNIALAYATDINNVLSGQNTAANKVISAELTQLSMHINTPASQNFNFLDSVRVYLRGPGLPEVLAARKYSIGTGLMTVDMDTTGVALKPYLLQDSVYVRLNARVHTAPAAGTKLSIDSKFRVTANPLN